MEQAILSIIYYKCGINTNAAFLSLPYMDASYSTGNSINKMANITQVVRTEKTMTTLKKSIIATNLDQVLSSTGPFTFFAPLDLAFQKMKSGVMEDLLLRENANKLTDLLNLHVVPGKIPFKDLKDGEKLKTLNGKQLLVAVNDNKVTIDGAVIQNKEVQTSNGVIHSLDTVLKN